MDESLTTFKKLSTVRKLSCCVRGGHCSRGLEGRRGRTRENESDSSLTCLDYRWGSFSV